MRDFVPAALVIVTNHHHTVILIQHRNYVDKVTCFAQRTKMTVSEYTVRR